LIPEFSHSIDSVSKILIQFIPSWANPLLLLTRDAILLYS
jgi:hypothetical protein